MQGRAIRKDLRPIVKQLEGSCHVLKDVSEISKNVIAVVFSRICRLVRITGLVRLDKLIAGEKLDELIPLEFIDALIVNGEREATQ